MLLVSQKKERELYEGNHLTIRLVKRKLNTTSTNAPYLLLSNPRIPIHEEVDLLKARQLAIFTGFLAYKLCSTAKDHMPLNIE